MRVQPKYECFDTYQGKPGQAQKILKMIQDHTDPEACLEWPHKRRPQGYGVVRHSGEDWRVHRLAFKIVHGEIPDDKIIMHSCDNPPCFNPNHLSIGTRTENAADRHSRGRTKAAYRRDKGEEHYHHKITEMEVREIRRLYEDGHTQTSLSARFGISQAHVSTIILRKAWNHVSD